MEKTKHELNEEITNLKKELINAYQRCGRFYRIGESDFINNRIKELESSMQTSNTN